MVASPVAPVVTAATGAKVAAVGVAAEKAVVARAVVAWVAAALEEEKEALAVACSATARLGAGKARAAREAAVVAGRVMG